MSKLRFIQTRGLRREGRDRRRIGRASGVGLGELGGTSYRAVLDSRGGTAAKRWLGGGAARPGASEAPGSEAGRVPRDRALGARGPAVRKYCRAPGCDGDFPPTCPSSDELTAAVARAGGKLRCSARDQGVTFGRPCSRAASRRAARPPDEGERGKLTRWLRTSMTGGGISRALNQRSWRGFLAQRGRPGSARDVVRHAGETRGAVARTLSICARRSRPSRASSRQRGSIPAIYRGRAPRCKRRPVARRARPRAAERPPARVAVAQPAVGTNAIPDAARGGKPRFAPGWEERERSSRRAGGRRPRADMNGGRDRRWRDSHGSRRSVTFRIESADRELGVLAAAAQGAPEGGPGGRAPDRRSENRPPKHGADFSRGGEKRTIEASLGIAHLGRGSKSWCGPARTPTGPSSSAADEAQTFARTGPGSPQRTRPRRCPPKLDDQAGTAPAGGGGGGREGAETAIDSERWRDLEGAAREEDARRAPR